MVGYIVFAVDRAVPVRHPPRARASRPRAVLPLLREARIGGGIDRGAGRRRRACCPAQRIGAIIAIERQIGLRNYIEGGIPLDAVLTYDLLLSIFQPSLAAARRRRDRPGRSRRGGRLLPAADGQPEAEQGARLAPPRRDRPDRGERRGRDRRVRGDRQHLDGRRTARSSAASTPRRCARGCARWCCSGAPTRRGREVQYT